MVLLVDFENVHANGLQGITALCKQDTLYLFYNDTLKITIDTHRSIEKVECEKIYQKVTTKTPNAADFLLVTILGDLIGNNSERSYAVISDDKGFDVVVKYWKSKNVDIVKCSTIKEAKASAADVEVNKDEEISEPVGDAADAADTDTEEQESIEEKVNELFVSAGREIGEDTALVARYIEKYKTKQGLNNALVKELGNSTTAEIYKIIKPLIKDKKGK